MRWGWRREDTSARAKADIARLNKAVIKEREGKERIRYRPVVVPDAVSPNASRIAGLFSKRVFLVEQGDTRFALEGVTVSGIKGVTYVNVPSGLARKACFESRLNPADS
ncbi:MAG: hypothetical protein BA862_07650 [Desulfobulbaceae bacterium S3730MH12]|nr:MAG: hypothetical protein BA866_06090 [Desulfobulbaceae bacterium S5133MH15]OEU55594.1 MAG: hypothetical protein BA862_07650 [Desulfobulbaceae bacterium S3730MH12]OEU82238.1 MAG: hypothetical protein BA873_04995 [Desulfobulbaceae bacterium C00003063]